MFDPREGEGVLISFILINNIFNMKPIINSVLSACIFILLLGSCKKDPEIITPVEYESCCGTEPVEFKPMVQGKARYVYIPNVFTPNTDGLNDLFRPVINEEIGHLEYILITRVGENHDDPTLYDSGFIGLDNLNTIGWNGLDKMGNPFRGLFEYAFYIVTKDGAAYIIKSTACAIQCGPDSAIFKDKTSCFYGSQANDSGIFESGKWHGESDCFK